jgi:glycosyltransferase involved in cell wall biosynthesis
MRVLHVTRDFPPRHCGGMSTAVAALACAQRRIGVDVAVISFDAWRPRRGPARPPAPAPAGAPDLPTVRVADPQQLAAARSRAIGWQAGVVHVHDPHLGGFASSVADALGAPLVYTAHVVHHRQAELRGGGERTRSVIAEDTTMRAAARIVAPSVAARTALLAAHPEAERKLRIVFHGIDDSAAARSAARRDRTADAPLIAVGRFADVKGTAELFAIIRAVREREPNRAVAVIGGVPANPRSERHWLRRWQNETVPAARERVQFTGWIDPTAVARWYRAAAAVIIPSRFETFGLVALEAMLHGLPIAAFDAGALGELIEHGVTGLLAPAGDTDALAAHALALLADGGLARRLGAGGAAHARTRFRWDRVLPELLSVYAEVSPRIRVAAAHPPEGAAPSARCARGA